jgi:rhodanese-related sulfurtransferase
MAEIMQWEIQPDELVSLQESGAQLRLIDCRELDEWYICKLPGAELIPLSSFAEDAPQKLGSDKDQHLVIYCHHGMRSMRAAQWLRQQGYGRTQSLHGGVDLWAEVIDPEMRRY